MQWCYGSGCDPGRGRYGRQVSTHPPAGGGAGRGRGRGGRGRGRVPQCGPPGGARLCCGDASCPESTSGAREGASLAPRPQARLRRARPAPACAAGPGVRGRPRRAPRPAAGPGAAAGPAPRQARPRGRPGPAAGPGIVAVRPHSVGDTVGGTSNGIVRSTLNGFGRPDHPRRSGAGDPRMGRPAGAQAAAAAAATAAAPATAATPATAAAPATAATQRLRRGVVRKGKTRIP